MIDLRSDTITRPTADMRRVMAGAEVGDDVYHDDPTVNRLEETVAGILGKDDAMYTPTGTMANEVAVRMHTQPGDTVVLERSAHIAAHELGGPALLSGVSLKPITGEYGVFSGDDVRSAIPVPHPSLPGYLFDPHTLVCVENTHNDAGGSVWGLEEIHAVTAAARERAAATHLDGARLWNASVATDVDVADYAAPFDSVSVCFSKGLGAPVGSALVGDREFIAEARRFKHLFGGGFRQAGILAAGALYALEHHRDRLGEDHANARRFAEAVADTEGASVDLASVQTNMVYFDVVDPGRIVDESLERGVAMLVMGEHRIRAVFHLDVSTDDTTSAIDIVTSVIDG